VDLGLSIMSGEGFSAVFVRRVGRVEKRTPACRKRGIKVLGRLGGADFLMSPYKMAITQVSFSVPRDARDTGLRRLYFDCDRISPESMSIARIDKVSVASEIRPVKFTVRLDASAGVTRCDARQPKT
jgi:hypothetical protein